jgi:hypothetical protein
VVGEFRGFKGKWECTGVQRGRRGQRGSRGYGEGYECAELEGRKYLLVPS